MVLFNFKKSKDLRKKTKKILNKKTRIRRYEPSAHIDLKLNDYKTCVECKTSFPVHTFVESLYCCPKCNFSHRINPKQRIFITFDKFKELYKNVEQTNPINMPGYEDKLKSAVKISGENSAVTTGVASIEDYTFATFILNHEFIMGSMGTVVGEKIKKIFQYATKHKLAVIGFSASGGARMHESMFSLMQMAKTSSAVGLHDSASLLYISVLTSPTYGGVTASFAMLGDIIIAEEKAMIGFAGRNVIKELTKEDLPKEFQSAEFLKEKGFIDIVVSRAKMKETLYKVLSLHFKKGKD